IDVGDIDGDGVLDMATVGSTSRRVNILTQGTETGAYHIDLLDQLSSEQAIEKIDESIDRLMEERSSVGSIQSRLQYAYRHAMKMSEAYADSHSRIMDIDLSVTIAELVQSQILQEASTAVLTQANLSSQLVLELLSDL